jgi:hypothetical protein
VASRLSDVGLWQEENEEQGVLQIHPRSPSTLFIIYNQNKRHKIIKYIMNTLKCLNFVFYIWFGLFLWRGAGRGEVVWQGRTSWNQLATGGDAPPARYGHSLVVLPTPAGNAKNRGPTVILFGGSNQVSAAVA